MKNSMKSTVEDELTTSNPTDIKVYEILLKNGPKTRSELVRLTGIARSTLYDSLVRLNLQGKVEKYNETPEGPGRPKVFFQVKKSE